VPSVKVDFASVDAFDRHRIGTHALTFSEGIGEEPPRIDGRRCMDHDEMIAAGLELDSPSRWRIASAVQRVAGWHTERAA
jgi:hypothetical protein